MVAGPKVITVEPDSDLGRILDEATERGAVLEKGGIRFRILREPAQETDQAWDALQRSFGILKGIDRERLKAELREQRGQDSQGRPGW